jgi:dinuclear metal center YbgI/SA1388 family protein
VAVAVDASQAAFDQAVEAGAQLLIVHHGIIWDEPVRLVGTTFRRVKTLIDGQCGLYAAHLPLDVHPEVGNDAELARLLGLRNAQPFCEFRGLKIGMGGFFDPPLSRSSLTSRVTSALGSPPVEVLESGPAEVRRVGSISGAAGSLLDRAAMAGLDTFITGEASHGCYHQAHELGINVVFGGHYATETLGVKALARHLDVSFDLETIFLDIPTGL